MKKTVAGVTILVLAGMTAGAYWYYSYTHPPIVKVVVSIPLGIEHTKSGMDAVRLAFAEDDFRAGRFTIELIELDDGDNKGLWDAKKEEENARLAAADPAVVAYIGPFNSAAAKIAIPILNEAGITIIGFNSWPGLTKTGFAPGEPAKFYPSGIRNYFRIVTTDEYNGPTQARWATELGFSRAYIVDDGETYGKGLADLFEETFKKIGSDVLGRESLNKTATDFNDVVGRIEAQDPDILYYGGTLPNGIIPLAKQLRAAGYIKAIMGASTIWDQKLIDGVGTSSEETYSSSAYIYPQNVGDSRGEEFLNAYREAYGTEPTVVAVTTYESANLIQQAIANGGPAREGVMEAMRKSDYDSMLGHVTFDQNGDRIEKFLVAGKVSDGAFHFVRKLDVVEQ